MAEFKLWVRTVIECSELSGLFCGKLPGKSVERNADDGGLACEASERCKDSTRAFVCYLLLIICGVCGLDLKSYL